MSKNHFPLAAVFFCGIILSFVQVALSNRYQSIGCYQDRGDRAIPTLEGQDPTLDGNYWTRQSPVAKCYAAAKRRGFQVFAVQNGGWCASGPTAAKTFNKYGPSSACRSDGEGGPWGNQVYYITDYENVGCYRDTSNRAIQPLEGRDSVLDGHYLHRRYSVLKCALAAKRAGYHMFAVQNGGWCASSRLAVETFNKYGPSSACKSDGEGGPWANQVYYIKDHESVGCYRDTSNRAIQPLEGRDSVLDGHYLHRRYPVLKCALAAKRAGYNMFAVQNGGWCASSRLAVETFNKYGPSSACRSDGEGGPWANQVYYMKDYESFGCYSDTSTRAINTLEGKDPILDGHYSRRKNPISKCAVAAMSAGYSIFAVQNGGWCASSRSAAETFNKYGRSRACRSDGEGGPWANQVYALKDHESIGCYRDTSNRAIQPLEGRDSVLDGHYLHRRYSVLKCALAAKRAGYNMFAVQNGGWCASSRLAVETFNKYGPSSACKSDGEGGPWANQVYYIKDHESFGCYRDTSTRAINTLEGKDPVLDGHYSRRKNPIAKCAVAAMRAGYSIFAVQNGGWCASSRSAAETFNKYGRSHACQSDGEGGPWANQVYALKASQFQIIGCYQDRGSRAIPTLEDKDPILDGTYWTRHNAIEKCYNAAKIRGFKVFALQNGGWCASSRSALKTLNKYGPSSACKSDGKGGPWANQVYYIKGYKSIGCYKDTANRAIQTLETKDSILDGPYWHRKHPIAKCAAAAMRAGYRMFAVQNGGWCASSAIAPLTFARYGKSTACKLDGEGGPWANQVYSLM